MERRRRTLERALSRAGVCSREEALRRIAAGRVRVNGLVARDARVWVDPEQDRIEVDGRALARRGVAVLALNKPVGYLTTRTDPGGRKTVYELLPADTRWVVPVGRLDRDTSGLLLLTNDTDLAAALTDPRSHVEKVYVVELAAALTDESLEALRRGIELDDGRTAPARVRRLAARGGRARIELALMEGKNRQVRRMVRALGSYVVALERVAIGPLRLGELAPGVARPLTRAEERRLRAALVRAAFGGAARSDVAEERRTGRRGGPGGRGRASESSVRKKQTGRRGERGDQR